MRSGADYREALRDGRVVYVMGIGRIGAQPMADRWRARAERQEPAGLGDQVAVGDRAGDLFCPGVVLGNRVDNTQRDQVSVSWVVGDIAR